MKTAKEAMKMWKDAIDAMYEAGSELAGVKLFGSLKDDEERRTFDEVYRICDETINAYERIAFGGEDEE